MNSDENAEDPSRKETQEFDPSLIDEKGIHPEPVTDADPSGVEQEHAERCAGLLGPKGKRKSGESRGRATLGIHSKRCEARRLPSRRQLGNLPQVSWLLSPCQTNPILVTAVSNLRFGRL